MQITAFINLVNLKQRLILPLCGWTMWVIKNINRTAVIAPTFSPSHYDGHHICKVYPAHFPTSNTIFHIHRPEAARGAAGSDEQLVPGAGGGDVQERSLLPFHLLPGQRILRLLDSGLGRNQPLRHADQEDDAELQPFGPVHRSAGDAVRSEEHTSELQSRENLVCRLLLEKKNNREVRSLIY